MAGCPPAEAWLRVLDQDHVRAERQREPPARRGHDPQIRALLLESGGGAVAQLPVRHPVDLWIRLVRPQRGE